MKKSVVLTLAIIMCLFAVTGSIAYFTDNITVQNEVQSGTLHIEQFEFERVPNSDRSLRKFSQNQFIYPSVGSVSHPTEAVNYNFSTTDKEGKTYDGTLTAKLMNTSFHGFVDKIVAVKNTGTLKVFVRTYVAVPTSFVEAVHLDWAKDNWVLAKSPITDTITVEDHKISNVPYTIYYATCTVDVAPGEISHPGLLGFYLDPQVNHNGTHYTLNGKELGTNGELKILVASVASQVIPTGIGDEPRDNALEAMRKTYEPDTEAPDTSNPDAGNTESDNTDADTPNTDDTVVRYHPWKDS